ncbi:MAG: DUF2259 domain-containing protein [Treponemataceae bacterium]|nr:DUF2259 domain-containing protein [Treponemataceae bacterium]
MTKKTVLCVLISLVCAVSLFAGDVATFDDIGISADGKTYLFGQYGMTDSTYQGYAELYAVDISENNYVKGGVKKTAPSKKTAKVSGAAVYEELKGANAAWLAGYKAAPASIDNTLYLRSDSKKAPTESITVTDFARSENGNTVTYTFTLIPTVEKKGKEVVSSFYISVQRTADGNTQTFIAGNKDIKRKDITGYAIEKIMVDPTGSRFIIVVEKTADSDKGPEVRYMVETFADVWDF